MDAVQPVVFPTRLEIFMPLIDRCVSMNPHERPSAAEVEKQLQNLETGFWAMIEKNSVKYYELSVEKRDEIFMVYFRAASQRAL